MSAVICHTLTNSSFFSSREVKGKLGSTFPNTGIEVRIDFFTFQLMGMEVINEHQLPMFCKVKQEVFSFFYFDIDGI